jgi:hypothetical protein
MSLTLEWMIGADDMWFRFDSVDLSSDCFKNKNGVFVVWYGPDDKGEEGRVVWVGHGHIRNSIAALRDEPTMTRYSNHEMLVTWAEVDSHHQQNVETYLTAVLHPLLGQSHPNVVQTIVNLPPW